jgi:hypothetical protein
MGDRRPMTQHKGHVHLPVFGCFADDFCVARHDGCRPFTPSDGRFCFLHAARRARAPMRSIGSAVEVSKMRPETCKIAGPRSSAIYLAAGRHKRLPAVCAGTTALLQCSKIVGLRLNNLNSLASIRVVRNAPPPAARRGTH